MSLNNFQFIIFFMALLAVMAFLQLFRRKTEFLAKCQLIILLLFSYYFIMKSNWRFCICIVVVSLLTYVLAIFIEKSDERHGKCYLIGGVVTLLGFLMYFKYTDFFLNSFRKIFGQDNVVLNIILPVGISFYVFSALSYLIDVYRRECCAEKDLLSFALFIAFFPKLTAGPIVRAKDFFPQVKEYRGVELKEMKIGIQIFVFGLFKKIVLADHLGVFVDDVFFAPAAYNTGTTILAVISYSLQIYFDFSGYSDMAIGIAKMLGFSFRPNFNLPYIAQTISDFWKRWHISLSSWFQDYLYIPLGGSRKGKIRTYINLMIVMLLSGLWHGAGWTFILWGALHGIASCFNKAFEKKRERLGRLGKCLYTMLTFFFVTLFWVVFRADSIETAWDVLRGLFTVHSGINQPYIWSFFAIGCFVVGTAIAVIHSKRIGKIDKNGDAVIEGFYPVLDLSKFWNLVCFLSLCGLTIILGYYGNTAFIYGAF